MAPSKNPLSTAVDSDSSKPTVGRREFCPFAGMVSGEQTGLLKHEIRNLLHHRLAISGLLLASGFALFLLKHLLSQWVGADEFNSFLPLHAECTILIAAFAVALHTRWRPSLCQLRYLELGIFGAPAAFFVWMQYGQCLHCAQMGDETQMLGFIAQACIPWLTLILVYSLFIPTSWQRAALMVGAMGLAPIVTAVAADASVDGLARWRIGGELSYMALWMCIPTVAGIYGSHRIGTLRRQAVEARELGSYRLRQLLGAGGMGEVYLAEHLYLKRPCAIKLIRPDRNTDPKALSRFESEVQATAKLTHWNTIEIYDYGRAEDGTFYYVMEYLPGLNLQELVDRYGPMPPARAIHLIRQVCAALKEAHDAGMVHRDIKPGNIFSARRGGVHDVAKLLDFGLVKSIAGESSSPNVTLDGLVVGSPLYAAPETTLGDDEPGPSADLYGLGATLYFLVTGKPLFEHENPLKLLFAHANEEVIAPTRHRPDLPADLQAVILKCLSKSPADRYADVSRLAAALAACSDADSWTDSDAADWWTKNDEAWPKSAPSTTPALAATASLELDSAEVLANRPFQ